MYMCSEKEDKAPEANEGETAPISEDEEREKSASANTFWNGKELPRLMPQELGIQRVHGS